MSNTPLVQSIGWALVHFVWQGTVIGVATGLALRILVSARPATRYAVACLSLALMLIVPVVAVVAERASGSPSVASVAAAASAVVPAASIDRLLPSAVVVWLAGVFLLSIRLVAACAVVERLKRATREVDFAVTARVRWLAQHFGIERPVGVFESTLVRVPTVVGYVRPVILLPASVITGLAPAYLDAVLAHELAHVRRHDYLVNALQSLVETLLFYHPVVWWCSRQIRIEREHCCDDMVVEAGGDRVRYATALAQLEELRGLQPMLSLNASGGRLVDRIRRLLGESPMKERRSTTWTIAAALAVVTAIVVTPGRGVADASELVASVQSVSRQSSPPPVPAPPAAPAAPAAVRDAGKTLKDDDWADYVRATQAALETLARETQGVAVFPEQSRPQPAPQPQAQPATQAQPAPQAQPTPQPAPQPAPQSQAQTRPQPPQPPMPPLPRAIAVPQVPQTPALAPTAPAPPLPPNAQVAAVPALPAPPAPPLPPLEPLGLDPDSIHELIKSATQQIAESFEELRRATVEVGLKQEAIRQAQAEMAKMRIESLSTRTQIEVMQKTLSEFSARSAASQLDRREMQKLIDELSAELSKLRDR